MYSRYFDYELLHGGINANISGFSASTAVTPELFVLSHTSLSQSHEKKSER